jgi:hypothetical protein
MNWLPSVLPTLSAQALRAELCDRFPRYLEALVHREGCAVIDVERGLGLQDAKIYEYFRGRKNFPLAILPMLPPAVELAILADRAAHHGRELTLTADAGEASLLRVISEAGDVLRTAATSEADGVISAKEARAELAEIEQLEAALLARKSMLKRAVRENGLRLGGAS